jgi:hypothetical protein
MKFLAYFSICYTVKSTTELSPPFLPDADTFFYFSLERMLDESYQAHCSPFSFPYCLQSHSESYSLLLCSFACIPCLPLHRKPFLRSISKIIKPPQRLHLWRNGRYCARFFMRLKMAFTNGSCHQIRAWGVYESDSP